MQFIVLQYYGKAFKIPNINFWQVVLTGALVEDVKRASDDELSIIEANFDVSWSILGPYFG